MAYFSEWELELDLSDYETAHKEKRKLKDMERQGAFDGDKNMPEAAIRLINRKFPPRPPKGFVA